MSVKEKAKAFEGRSSVIGESPPPRKKSREELIGSSDDDNLERRSSTGAPEPPPRKYKKNGKLKSSGEYSPNVERKENIPTSGKDSQTRQKPPRPPPPPRGSSLGRKSQLLSSLKSQPSGEKKKKPPVPPKPKNYVSKKASLTSVGRVKSEKKIVSQPTKERSDSAPASSTPSNAHKSQFFVSVEKDDSIMSASKKHESNMSSQFFDTTVEEQTPNNENGTVQKFEESSGDISSEHASIMSDDEALSDVRNGFAVSNGIHENGVASGPHIIQPGKINMGKDTTDPLEGLEITVDNDSSGDDDISPTVLEDKNEHVDVFQTTASVNVDDVMSNNVCNEFKPVDSSSESKENVQILYSVELEEECSVTRIENNTERVEPDDASAHHTSFLHQTEVEETLREISTMNNEVEMAAEDKSFDGGHVSENLASENLSLVTNEEEKDKMREDYSIINCINHKEEYVSNFEVEEQVDTILDNLSDETEEIVVKEDPSIDEVHFQRPLVEESVKCETDLHLEGSYVDSTEEKELENPKDESIEAVTDIVTESQPNESRKNSEVIMAEPIREGTLLSVTDRVVSKEISDADEEKNHEELSDEKIENVDDEDHPVNELEHPDEEFKDKNDEQQSNDVAQLEPGLVLTASEEMDSCQGISVELNKDEQSGEELLEHSVSENVSTDEGIVSQTESVTSDNAEQAVDREASSSEVTEPILLEMKEGQVECTVNTFPNSTEENLVTASLEEADLEEPTLQENEDANEPHSPQSPQPTPPERRNRKARQQKHGYENIDLTSQQAEQITNKSDSLRKTQSFSKYESVVLSLPRPVQRVSDDEAIYRVPSKVVPVDSFANDESEYSVPYPITSRTCSITQEEEYAVPKSIIVKAHAVTDAHAEDDGEIYSVPGQVTPVPVVETFAASSGNESVPAIPQEDDNEYAVPVQLQQKPATTTTVSAVPPPKPPRTSLSKEEFKVNAVETSSSGSTETTKRESPKPAPRTREQKNSPSPVPRKSSKTAASSESSTTTGGESPVPVPRTRLNALQTDKEASSSNVSSSELSTLSSSEVSAVETTEDEQTLKRKPPPRPPPPSGRTSIINNDDSEVPPLTPGPFANEADSDTDSDVGEDASPKGPPKPKLYYIAHEILSTERTFVDALKLVFEECYGTIKSANVVADAILADIFRDLENIYLLDSKFLQELEERMETWEEHERIGDIIKRYSHFLKMYTQFVNGYDKAIGVFQDTMKENSEFANLVSQFQASERCHGIGLSAYMLKPVQRIPSYRLLLIDYLKHLPKDSEESKDTEAALKTVSEVAMHINESMKKMENFEQMLKVQRSLVGHPEIVKAGRDYIKEGTLMKLCRKDMQERMFFLLTDVLLYTTPVGGNQYKLNKMLPLLGMQVTVPDSPDFVNEFSIISTTRSFTLTASTPEERDQWVEALNNAIDVVTKRKITFVNKTRDAAGLGVQEQDEDVNSVKLGEKAPVWIPDHRVTMCMSCTSPFTLTNRRHHCRACGNVVCGACSESTAPLAYLEYNQARVCDKCYDMLLKEFHTDEIHVVEQEEEAATLPPLLQEAENAEKLLKKPTKFEMMRRFKSRKSKRKSQIMHPSHLTEVVANQVGSQMSGYLKYKKGKHGWKKSWFVLKDNVLYSYKASSDVVALETLPVLSYEIEDLGKDGNDFVFQLKHHGVAPLVFKAENETSGTRWIKELKKAITMES